MNIIKTSTVTLLLASTLAMAGGDIAPIEPEINTPEVIEAESALTGFYAGLGYSYMKMKDDTADTETTGHAISVQAGYNFNPYLAVEGRYTATLSDLRAHDADQNWDMSNVAIFLKPKYTVDRFTLYGLLGYGQVTFDNGTSYSEDGFQWGLGASMMATDNIDVFVDYTRLYDDDGFDTLAGNNDISVDSVNVGVNYNF
jgi:opacity protein-like surface antigen